MPPPPPPFPFFLPADFVCAFFVSSSTYFKIASKSSISPPALAPPFLFFLPLGAFIFH
jgi:hypothetical protein